MSFPLDVIFLFLNKKEFLLCLLITMVTRNIHPISKEGWVNIHWFLSFKNDLWSTGELHHGQSQWSRSLTVTSLPASHRSASLFGSQRGVEFVAAEVFVLIGPCDSNSQWAAAGCPPCTMKSSREQQHFLSLITDHMKAVEAKPRPLPRRPFSLTSWDRTWCHHARGVVSSWPGPLNPSPSGLWRLWVCEGCTIISQPISLFIPSELPTVHSVFQVE